ncbi:hypothetical protein NBRC116592_28100 [Colwellia sp. KU-HH00111]
MLKQMLQSIIKTQLLMAIGIIKRFVVLSVYTIITHFFESTVVGVIIKNLSLMTAIGFFIA